jgi:hypothetical protein
VSATVEDGSISRFLSFSLTAVKKTARQAPQTNYGYEAPDPHDPWKVYDTTAPGWVNDLSVLSFGQSYCINVSQAITLMLRGGSGVSLDSPKSLCNPPATYYGPVAAGVIFTPTAGMPVTAWIDGNRCGQSETLEVDGQVVYVIDVPPAEPGVGTCGAYGREVSFRVGTQVMAPTVSWRNKGPSFLALMPAPRHRQRP